MDFQVEEDPVGAVGDCAPRHAGEAAAAASDHEEDIQLHPAVEGAEEVDVFLTAVSQPDTEMEDSGEIGAQVGVEMKRQDNAVGKDQGFGAPDEQQQRVEQLLPDASASLAAEQAPSFSTDGRNTSDNNAGDSIVVAMSSDYKTEIDGGKDDQSSTECAGKQPFSENLSPQDDGRIDEQQHEEQPPPAPSNEQPESPDDVRMENVQVDCSSSDPSQRKEVDAEHADAVADADNAPAEQKGETPDHTTSVIEQQPSISTGAHIPNRTVSSASRSNSKRTSTSRKRKTHPLPPSSADRGSSGDGSDYDPALSTSTSSSSGRRSKRGRLQKTVQQTDSPDDDLKAALRLSMASSASPGSGPPRYGTVSAASSVGLMEEVVDSPSLIDQVVRLTDEGKNKTQWDRILGVDPRLYYVLSYKAESNWCELVPMKKLGPFSEGECGEAAGSVGRDKWVLFSEERCGDVSFEISGDLVEIVNAKPLVNATDANEEQWDILGAIESDVDAVDTNQGDLDDEDGNALFFITGGNTEDSSRKKDSHGLVAEGAPSSPKFKRNNVVHAIDEAVTTELSFGRLASTIWEKDGRYDKWLPESDLKREPPPEETAGSHGSKVKAVDTSKAATVDVTGIEVTIKLFAKCSGSGCPGVTMGDLKDPAAPNSDGMWEVEKVVGRRWNAQQDRIEYLTQWVGCPNPEQNTWEPEENFSLPSLSIFERMWEKCSPPPLDGRAELLTKDEISKMSLLKQGGKSAIGQPGNKPQKECGGGKDKGGTKAGEKSATSENASIRIPKEPLHSPSRRSTRLRMPIVPPPPKDNGSSRSRRSSRRKQGVIPPHSREQRGPNAVTTEEKPAGYVPPIDEQPTCRTSVVDWTPINECILLLSGLEHPEDLAAVGPGIWMAKKSEWAFEGDAPTTSRQIRHHWEEMVHRDCKGELTGFSAVNYASHVLNAALASESAAAKTLALTAAGWYRVPGGDPSCRNTMWHRPNMPLGTYVKLSENQYWRTRPQSMEQAWEAHIAQIRDGIEDAWIPQERYADDVIEEVEDNVEEEMEGARAIEEAEEGKEQESGRKEHEKKPRQRAAVPASHSHNEHSERSERARCERLMEIRKNSLQDGDPRPSRTCHWCGPKQYDESAYVLKHEEQKLCFEAVPAGCEACRYLEELGWRFTFKLHILSASDRIKKGKHHQNDSKFRTPNGHVIYGVKRFLEATTPLVGMEFGKNRSSETKSAPGQREKLVKASSMDVETSKEGSCEKSENQETEVDTIEIQQPTQYKQREITRPPLPPHSYLLKLERGLVSALAADELHLWNVNYGANSTVALHTIRSLATGKLPHAVQIETPFFRPRNEMCVPSHQEGAPPTRFLGVTRVIGPFGSESRTGKQYSGNFGVEFPLFDVDKEPLLPQSATVKGRTVLIRHDLTEDVAGKLFAFMYRLLYGAKAVERCLQRTNALSEQATFTQDTLRAFGTTKDF
eukprot:CAMPEP_0178571116 /NCGR_PEP_ID=MMETSP0697-20121206/17453_1 /TAXON_ID=265572 /ORGANISM="Extubocellulus spinifer, Strain CCMP396" /LENGTH=1459 /DNA_ID=CAMNT_0020205627 /DNA_START=152 /DNA_END=4532 /DNA_ORIENTATION=-